MEIRHFEERDFDQLIRAWRAASVVAHPFLSPEFLDAEVESIRDMYLPVADAWVAIEDDQVIGFMALLGQELGAIFVHPSHWKKGVGHKLMDKAVEMRDNLSLEVFKENSVARRFYERYGFTEATTSKHKETGQTVIRMTYQKARKERHA